MLVSKQTAGELIGRLMSIVGTQERAAALLGVRQPNVSRWINNGSAEMSAPVRLLAERAIFEFEVRSRWIEKFLFDRATGRRLELVRKDERVRFSPKGRKAKLLDREIEVIFTEANGRHPSKKVLGLMASEMVAAAAASLAAEYLDSGWAASGDFFGFYAEEDGDIRLISFHANTEAPPATGFGSVDDPLFGG